jgi:hypothetical protein
MISELVALAIGFTFLVGTVLLVVAIAEAIKRTTPEQQTWIGIIGATLVISYVSGKVILVVLRTEGLI